MLTENHPRGDEIKKEIDRRYHLNQTSVGRINHIADYALDLLLEQDKLVITVSGSKNDPAMLKGEGVRSYVARRISGILNDLAVVMADQYAAAYAEDMPTGALAFEVMKAEMDVLTFWAKYADKKHGEKA